MTSAVSYTLSAAIFNLSLLHPSESPWGSIISSTDWSSLHQGEEHAVAEVSPALIILCGFIVLPVIFIWNKCYLYTFPLLISSQIHRKSSLN